MLQRCYRGQQQGLAFDQNFPTPAMMSEHTLANTVFQNRITFCKVWNGLAYCLPMMQSIGTVLFLLIGSFESNSGTDNFFCEVGVVVAVAVAISGLKG